MGQSQKEIKAMSLLIKRVTKLDDQLRLIGNLSNKQHYELSSEKIASLEFYLTTQVALTINRLKENKEANFTFDILDSDFTEVLKGG